MVEDVLIAAGLMVAGVVERGKVNDGCGTADRCIRFLLVLCSATRALKWSAWCAQ